MKWYEVIILYDDVMCCVCKKEPALSNWMCRKCYDKIKYLATKDNNKIDEYHQESERTIKMIAECLKGEKTQTQIAKEFNVTRQRVSYIMKRYERKMKSHDT